MSLRYFHLFFMTAAAACFGAVAVWAGRQSQPAYLALSTLSLVGCAAYLRWFYSRYLAA